MSERERIPEEDLLLSRIADGAAGPEDWEALEIVAAGDRGVWERLGHTLRCEAELREDVAAATTLADALDRRHQGAVARVDVDVESGPGCVRMTLHGMPGAPAPVVELDAVREKGGLFEEVFGVRLEPALEA